MRNFLCLVKQKADRIHDDGTIDDEVIVENFEVKNCLIVPTILVVPVTLEQCWMDSWSFTPVSDCFTLALFT